jgi:tRNA (mo5U34)-methyltransferase
MGDPATLTPEQARREVEGREWYHTFELAPGLETPGWFDLRPLLPKIPFPASLVGQRCLDVGTFDGFWAFSMERLGGEVVAIDVLDPLQWDWPASVTQEAIEAIGRRKRGGEGFELIANILGSEVERRELSVYDLDPAEIGSFDLVYVGSLLLHLRDPVSALMRVRNVCTGTLILCDAISPMLSLVRRPIATLDGRDRPWWWRPNVAALERMVYSAGFRRVSTRRVRMAAGKGRVVPPAKALRTAPGRQEFLEARFGEPHAVIQAEVR